MVGSADDVGDRGARRTQLALDRHEDVYVVEYDKCLRPLGYACTDLSSSTARPRQKAR